MRNLYRIILACSIAVSFGPARSPAAEGDDDPMKATVLAPADTVRVSGGAGGAYFADKVLVKRYNDLKTRLKAIKRDILAGRPSSETALRELSEIEARSKEIRETIDATKTFVTAFKAYKKTQEVVFPLAESECIIMRGDSVRMRGWAGPGIKVVLEKVILAKEKPEAKEFDAIRVEHSVGVAEDLVGKTKAERAADQKAFRESPDGKKMTEEQLASREAFVRRLFGSYDRFHQYQGVAANLLSIHGLRYDQGNEQVSYQIKTPSGGGYHSSAWKRQAAVTIYVPSCKQVLVAGCMVKLDIADVRANLMLSTSDEHDRDYEGTFVVRSIDGDVVIDQAPVRVLDGVTGNVTCTVTNEFANSGTMHSGGFRTAEMYETAKTEISNVKGDLKAHFLRTNLHLSNLQGAIDIHNDYGSTSLLVTDPDWVDRPMRIISHSGKVALSGKQSVLKSIPTYAYTQCGTLHTNLPQKVLEDINVSTGSPERNWQGFITPSKERFSMERFERPGKAVNNEDRADGLDLISHSGRVEILTADQ